MGGFKYGDFLNHLLAFLIIAAVVYWLVITPMTRLVSLFERDRAAATKQCPDCLSEVPAEARRCAYCTVELVPQSGQP
ncbi:MscL family protein [Nonomuraea endophytica]|uniref:MscL family protein n=1 Tax=Nonomuraea endophytica TaxID=714136 RepID=UPI0037C56D13